MTRNLWGRFTTGTIIVLVGLLLLLATTETIEFTSIWELVPLIFVLLGVWALVRSEFRNLVGPVMVIAIAGAYFARNLGLISDGAIGTWWPLFVILFGLLVLFNRSRRRQRYRLEGVHGASEVSTVAVFGSDERRIVSDQFGGAELVTIFGDTLLDLREADVASPPAVVESMTVFGDAEIRVPSEWDVRLETLNIFGSTRDRRPAAEERDGAEPTLVVTGVSLFADITIRD